MVTRPAADRVLTATGGDARAGGDSSENAVAVRDDPRVNATIVAIAGAHGSVRAARSTIGARMAADIAATKAEAAVAALASTDAAALAPLGDMLAERIAEQWQSQLRELSAAQPGATDEDDPLAGYGTGLLLAIVTPAAVLAMQLGDGDIVLHTDDGEMLRPVATDAPDDAGDAGDAASLAAADAQQRFRHATIDRTARDIALVLLAAGGAAAAPTDPPWSTTLAADLVAQADASGIDAVEAQLPERVAGDAPTGDELAVALVFPAAAVAPIAAAEVTDPRLTATIANPAVAAAGATAAMAASATSEHPAVAPVAPPKRKRRGWIAAALVACAIALAIGLVLALGNDNGGTNPATTVTTAPTTAPTSTTSSTTTTPATTAPASTAPSTAAPTTVPVVVTVPPTSAPPRTTTNPPPPPTTTAPPTTTPPTTASPPTT